MEKENIYEIFTDASFDDSTKLSTYSVVIIKDNKIKKAFGKKCNMQLENSTEGEVFAIFQAINIIEANLIKKNITQKFWLRTDCVVAKDFFVDKKKNVKLFKQNQELYDNMIETFNRVAKKMSKERCSFKLRWVPRGANKIAHKYSYTAFKEMKTKQNKNNIIVTQRKLLDFLKKFDTKQCKVLVYLNLIANEKKLILKTQNEIASSLEISKSSVNRIFKELKNLNFIEKLNNGKYILKESVAT